jgi:Tfp pilus assembly protein PilF
MQNWRITGFIATLIIVLIIPISALKYKYFSSQEKPVAGATYVGHKKCIDCHKGEYEKWLNSHHDKAMDEANETTVLGDFNNAVFEHKGITSRFYRRNGKFYVHTQGPGGQMGDFEIAYTFGVSPLQQYLVPFPNGRLQCLPIAWDVKEKKWYHLYPNENIDPGDWLYWTNAGQNWNAMCAECHSTNLKKGYDFKTDTYHTTWSEIDVSCESCHGPGSRHVEWAEIPEMARSDNDNYGLVIQTGNISSRKQVELCAPCHSRRSSLGDFDPLGRDMLDNTLPRLLAEGLYFPDGQILEEVYVYGSFTQSKMYDRDIRCGDCHDVHSVKRVKEGNELCLQCHMAAIYDRKEHHFHKKNGEKGEPIRGKNGKVLFEVGTGTECVQCHMPGRYYMGPDYRPDHSIRIPRPDLSIRLGVPNACNRCHIDKTNQWSEEYMVKWYGISRRPCYGTTLDAGRKGLPDARKPLIKLSEDPLYPVIVRATALALLSFYPDEQSTKAMQLALDDPEALIRQAAIAYSTISGPEQQIKLIGPLLYDEVKAVRIEAARTLTVIPLEQLGERLKKPFQSALLEYRNAMEYSADFTAGRLNLGNMYANLGQVEKAEENYTKAIRIDKDFFPAQINLAILYNRIGKNNEAELLLREVMKSHPELHEAAYSLGLLLAEEKRFDEAATYLEIAAKGSPNRGRIFYNLGLLLQHLKKESKAEAALLKALETDPDNLDYLYAVAHHYIRRKKMRQAKTIVEQIISKHPHSSIGPGLLNLINNTSPAKN